LIYGFSHTHLSGTGCDDWCDILVTPGGKPSHFSHKKEKASPGYYQVFLEDTGVEAKLTAGRRSAMHEYKFSGPASITVDLRHRDPLDDYEINVKGNVCYGHRTSSSWARGQRVYFYMEFSEKAIWKGIIGPTANIFFPGKKLAVRVGISSVSWQNAKENLMSDYPKSFKEQKKATGKAWEAYLGKVQCPYKDKEHKKRFYSALYHTAIHPTLYSDVNGEYRGMDGEIHKAEGWERYTVFSLWDTFRGLHPLLMEIEPERSVDFIRSMLSIFDEAGKLPVWELSG
jgi:putative alpha-1,2-mannosidase